jgi:hypothetical protein
MSFMERIFQELDPVAAFMRVCLCARRDPEQLLGLRRASSAASWSWQEFLHAADQEHLAPQLYSILRCSGLVPAPVEAELYESYLRSAARNLLLLRALTDDLGRLASAGVLVIVLKGATLAGTVYEDPALRPMSDIDLLVPPEHVSRAVDAFKANGYETPSTEMRSGARLAYENEVEVRRPGAVDIRVDIHWSLLDSPLYRHKPSQDWLWGTALPVRVGGTEALMLGPEAQILHLCAHLAFHHGGQGPLWLNDVAEVAHYYRDGLDWQMVLEQAKVSNLVFALQKVLPRVAAGWLAPIPDPILTTLETLHPSAVEMKIHRWRNAEGRSVAREVLSDLISLSELPDQLRYLAAKLFPPPAYMRQRYRVPHPLLCPPYYPYRWLLGLQSAIATGHAAFAPTNEAEEH